MSAETPTHQHTGLVMSIAGRSVQLYAESVLWLKTASRVLRPIVGDLVQYNGDQKEGRITTVHARKNCLMRTFGQEDREIAANLDRLFVITAPATLFNTIAIDRVSSVAFSQDIPCTIVLNKIDLGIEAGAKLYHQAGYELIETSAKYDQGMDGLHQLLRAPNLNVVALCGVSGVGKSTLLERLVPGLSLKTSEVSVRTGQGRQTTSQASGHLYEREKIRPLLIIDLPGSHQFGVSHLSKTQIAASFLEFQSYRERCQYSDCFHLAEPDCAVKQALLEGKLAISRYESYKSMIAEIDQMPDSRKYRRGTH